MYTTYIILLYIIFFFNYVNKQLHKTNTISPLKCIDEINIKINLTDIDKARCLSDQFSSIFTIPSTGIIHSFRKPSKLTPTLTFDKYPITPEIVRKCACLLPNKFNVSPDGLSKGLLKNLSFELCYPLSIVFTRILNDGICPLIWKKSNITALYKKGDSTLPSNYRPISILSSTLILYEQILSYYLSYYLRSNGLICSEQYGFLSGKSTQLQLIEFYRNIMR